MGTLFDAETSRPGRWLQYALFMGLLVLGFMVGLTQAAWATPVLTGSVQALAGDAGPQVLNDTGVQVAAVGPLTVSTSAAQGGASAGGTMTANYGVITGSAGAFFSGTNPGGGAGVFAFGRWEDIFTVGSSTLAPGTAVTLSGLLTLDLSETAVGATSGSAAAFVSVTDQGAYTNGTVVGFLNPSQVGTFSLSAPVSINTFVGDNLDISGQLQLAPSINGIGSMTLDASHTSIFTLASATSGADFTTLSGASYAPQASAAPEPSTLLFLGSGLVGLVAWRWKRAA